MAMATHLLARAVLLLLLPLDVAAALQIGVGRRAVAARLRHRGAVACDAEWSPPKVDQISVGQ
eukprot:6160422-Prymnesium_polylepis.1